MSDKFSFFFYDYESFGVSPALDRPAQFAGIRTDADFNIIGEPVMFFVGKRRIIYLALKP